MLDLQQSELISLQCTLSIKYSILSLTNFNLISADVILSCTKSLYLIHHSHRTYIYIYKLTAYFNLARRFCSSSSQNCQWWARTVYEQCKFLTKRNLCKCHLKVEISNIFRDLYDADCPHCSVLGSEQWKTETKILDMNCGHFIPDESTLGKNYLSKCYNILEIWLGVRCMGRFLFPLMRPMIRKLATWRLGDWWTRWSVSAHKWAAISNRSCFYCGQRVYDVTTACFFWPTRTSII